MTTTAALRNCYSSYLNAANLWLRQHRYDVDANVRVIVRPLELGLASVATDVPLYFKNWPYRDGSAERIDIVASVQEKVQLSDGHCVQSTVRVVYFRIEGANRAIATECLHYDFNNPPEKRHPICHVQSASSAFPLPDTFMRTRTDCVLDGIHNRCQTMRIPCAFVNLPGLFAILSADHMTDDYRREFMGSFAERHAGFPSFTHRMLGDIAAGNLCAWTWYDS